MEKECKCSTCDNDCTKCKCNLCDESCECKECCNCEFNQPFDDDTEYGTCEQCGSPYGSFCEDPLNPGEENKVWLCYDCFMERINEATANEEHNK